MLAVNAGLSFNYRAHRLIDGFCYGPGITEYRQIQEYSMFAENSATGPARVENKTQIRLTHRLVAGQQHEDTLRSAFNGEIDVGEKVGTLQIEALKILLRTHLHDDFCRAYPAQIDDFDSRTERLIQRGFQGKRAQAKSIDLAGHQTADCGKNGSSFAHHIVFPTNDNFPDPIELSVRPQMLTAFAYQRC